MGLDGKQFDISLEEMQEAEEFNSSKEKTVEKEENTEVSEEE